MENQQMKCLVSFGLPTVLIVLLSIGFGFNWQEPQTKSGEKASSVASSASSLDGQFAPIDNMHHFMEYVSQPSYLALKAALAEVPKERSAWKQIRSDALILAETSALVAQRFPADSTEEQIKQWREMSLAVYQSGKALYGSSGDFTKAKENFGLMIDNCNHCHQVFDDGKHQLEK